MEAKMPGGKLARLTVKNGGRREVVLSGDFFIYPGEGILVIEQTLSRLAGDEPLELIESTVQKAILDHGIELVGLDVPMIARLFRSAAHVESHRA